MAAKKHTPGPWKTGHHPDPKCSCMYVFAGKDQFDLGVCTLYEDEPTNAANARLIAAAPDLLAALESLVEFVGYKGVPEGATPNCVLDSRAAIKRAVRS